jgi:hypothetical protein
MKYPIPCLAALAWLASGLQSAAQDTGNVPVAPAVPVAEPVAEPASDPPAPKGPPPIKITSEGGAEMEPAKNMFVYLDKVRFEHPSQDMFLTCNRLEVYREDPPPPPPKPALEEEAALGEAPPPAEAAPDIKMAIATGNVYIEKTAPDGGKRIGRGKKAIFDAKTREVQLLGMPVLEVDGTVFKALREDCEVFLKEDGKHRLKGPFDTLVRQGGKR